MAAKQGDFLLLNYTLKVKESGETVDTTIDSVAKTAHLHREDNAYGPKFIILGEGWIPKGLEESLVGMDSGKTSTVELTPEKGYGARDPTKMRLVPLRRFREKGLDPSPGAQVELDGRPAVVRAVGAGRVQVDYNHPLAGRTLIYDVSIEKVLEDDDEKVLSIISRRIPEVANVKFNLIKNGENLTIEVPEEAFYLSGIQVAKKAITSDIQKFFPAIENIAFLEAFKRSKKEPQPPEPETTTEVQSPPTAAQEMVEEKPQESGAATKPDRPRRRATARKATEASHQRPKSGSENQR